MLRLIAAVILLPLLYACGKKDEPPPAAPPAQTVPAVEPSAPGAPPPSAPEPTTSTKSPSGTYVVVKGDTLYAIAKKHGLDHRELAKWNNIEDARRLRVGQELKLSAPG